MVSPRDEFHVSKNSFASLSTFLSLCVVLFRFVFARKSKAEKSLRLIWMGLARYSSGDGRGCIARFLPLLEVRKDIMRWTRAVGLDQVGMSFYTDLGLAWTTKKIRQ